MKCVGTPGFLSYALNAISRHACDDCVKVYSCWVSSARCSWSFSVSVSIHRQPKRLVDDDEKIQRNTVSRYSGKNNTKAETKSTEIPYHCSRLFVQIERSICVWILSIKRTYCRRVLHQQNSEAEVKIDEEKLREKNHQLKSGKKCVSIVVFPSSNFPSFFF